MKALLLMLSFYTKLSLIINLNVLQDLTLIFLNQQTTVLYVIRFETELLNLMEIGPQGDYLLNNFLYFCIIINK